MFGFLASVISTGYINDFLVNFFPLGFEQIGIPMIFVSSCRIWIFKLCIWICMEGIQTIKKHIYFIRNRIQKINRIIWLQTKGTRHLSILWLYHVQELDRECVIKWKHLPCTGTRKGTCHKVKTPVHTVALPCTGPGTWPRTCHTVKTLVHTVALPCTETGNR